MAASISSSRSTGCAGASTATPSNALLHWTPDDPIPTMPVGRRPAAATGILAAPGPRPKRTDVIIEVLREEIVSGRLPPGARLPTERELANHYGVSQPTVREVIRAFDVMGLVDVRHGSGAYVRGDSAYLMATALQTML